MAAAEPEVVVQSPDSFMVNIKTLTDETFMVSVVPTDTVYDFKCKIMSMHSGQVEPGKQKLLFRGQILTNDSNTVVSHGISSGHTVHLVISKTIAPDVPDSYQRGAYDGEDETAQLIPAHAAVAGGFWAQHQQNGNANIGVILQAQGDMPGIEEMSQSIKLIQMFSIIDVLLLLLFCIWGAYIFLVIIPLAACGYYGAKKLNRWALAGYGLFMILAITFRVILCAYHPTVLMIILTVVSVLLELYVMRKLIILWRCIPYMDAQTRAYLLTHASIDAGF